MGMRTTVAFLGGGPAMKVDFWTLSLQVPIIGSIWANAGCKKSAAIMHAAAMEIRTRKLICGMAIFMCAPIELIRSEALLSLGDTQQSSARAKPKSFEYADYMFLV
jgi:hypothetical protein